MGSLTTFWNHIRNITTGRIIGRVSAGTGKQTFLQLL